MFCYVFAVLSGRTKVLAMLRFRGGETVLQRAVAAASVEPSILPMHLVALQEAVALERRKRKEKARKTYLR